MWHSLQSKRKKSGDTEEEEGKERDAKKKNKGNEGGLKNPEEPSKDEEAFKDEEAKTGNKEEKQDGDSQGEEEQGADEESADKHEVHSYIADWLRCISRRRHHVLPF